MSEWTINTLKDHLLAAIAASDLRYEQRFQSQKEEIGRTAVASDKRFESVNEFRAQLKDQAGTFLPASEAGQRFAALEERLRKVESGRTGDEGRHLALMPLWALWALIGAVVAGVAVSEIVALFIRAKP